MEYTVKDIGRMAGVSARTLRYYDQIGLLSPKAIRSNGYRIYGQEQIDLLQHILFYRSVGVALEDMKNIIYAPGYNKDAALQQQLHILLAKREQLDTQIDTLKKTLSATKGECAMKNDEKFEGFKQSLLDENEEKYGAEIRKKYGDKEIDASCEKMKNMTAEQYAETESLSKQINESLKKAFDQGDPASPLAEETCALHKKWLCQYWPSYSKEAHKNLAQMYVDDPRFTAYYDQIAPGCAVFLRDALMLFCQ